MPDRLLLHGRDATLSFGPSGREVTAVRAASFALFAVERIALVGPSGSGKSSLLHMLAGLVAPSHGRIEWPGLGGRADRLRPGPVALAFQGPSLIPALTVLENTALPILLAGGTERAAWSAAATMLERLGLGGLAAKLPEELSGGQAQRVGLARALAGRPQLLLADEPTGQLDQATAHQVACDLRALADETGMTLVVATHDPIVANQFPARWSMANGVLTAEVHACSI